MTAWSHICSLVAVILSIESPKAGELHSLAQMSGEQLQLAIAANNSEDYLLWLHALATGLCVRQAVEFHCLRLHAHELPGWPILVHGQRV